MAGFGQRALARWGWGLAISWKKAWKTNDNEFYPMDSLDLPMALNPTWGGRVSRPLSIEHPGFRDHHSDHLNFLKGVG